MGLPQILVRVDQIGDHLALEVHHLIWVASLLLGPQWVALQVDHLQGLEVMGNHL